MDDLPISKLLDFLLHSDDEVWRDDAAQMLATAIPEEGALDALIVATQSPLLDKSLILTCMESIAEIILRRQDLSDKIDVLDAESRKFVETLICGGTVRL